MLYRAKLLKKNRDYPMAFAKYIISNKSYLPHNNTNMDKYVFII